MLPQGMGGCIIGSCWLTSAGHGWTHVGACWASCAELGAPASADQAVAGAGPLRCQMHSHEAGSGPTPGPLHKALGLGFSWTQKSYNPKTLKGLGSRAGRTMRWDAMTTSKAQAIMQVWKWLLCSSAL